MPSAMPGERELEGLALRLGLVRVKGLSLAKARQQRMPLAQQQSPSIYAYIVKSSLPWCKTERSVSRFLTARLLFLLYLD